MENPKITHTLQKIHNYTKDAEFISDEVYKGVIIAMPTANKPFSFYIYNTVEPIKEGNREIDLSSYKPLTLQVVRVSSKELFTTKHALYKLTKL